MVPTLGNDLVRSTKGRHAVILTEMHFNGCGLCKGNCLFILLEFSLENMYNVHISLLLIM